MTDNFYIEFEKRFRGSRELVRERLTVYLPLILALKEEGGDLSAIDMGCGRGEWIELLSENGFVVKGFDLDKEMVEFCLGKGLNVSNLDILQGLRMVPTNSQSVISAFHLAEHLPFERLREVVEESLRVLKPGGFLILETPNPENIMVSTLNFHLDPTHKYPIPPQLLSFVCEHAGFVAARILRLGLGFDGRIGLSHILGLTGINQDYSVIAQKDSVSEPQGESNRIFQSINSENPIPLLINKQELQLRNFIESTIDQSIHNIDARLSRLEAHWITRLANSMDSRLQLLKKIIFGKSK